MQLTEICTVRLDAALYRRVLVKAKREGRPVSNFIRHILRQATADVELPSGDATRDQVERRAA